MTQPVEAYTRLMAVSEVTSITIDQALGTIGDLTDLATQLGKEEGLRHAITLSDQLTACDLPSPQRAMLYYFTANAWNGLYTPTQNDRERVWNWEHHELEQQVVNLRRALSEPGVNQLPARRRCQILTNLSSALSHIGRSVEAIERWDSALLLMPSLAMARGNRGLGLYYYANALYDDAHAAMLMREAYVDLQQALLGAPDPHAVGPFRNGILSIASKYTDTFLIGEVDMDRASLGDTTEEREYRQWCLAKRLFLNPLNDLGAHSIAAHDGLSTPPMATKLEGGTYYGGLVNQLKQEFISARYFYYEGTHRRLPHFADKDTFLTDTLDYPAYSIGIEQMKIAFRMAYSVLDKIAFFFNHYLDLDIDPHRVYFKSLWYESGKKKKGLKSQFAGMANWPLRGLFWLSKDFYEERDGFRDSIEPEAQKLHLIRNHLEHKYLKLHSELCDGDRSAGALPDTLAYSLHRGEFDRKTLALLKRVRAAIIYLLLAVHTEEQRRSKVRSEAGKQPLSISTGIWPDCWKR